MELSEHCDSGPASRAGALAAHLGRAGQVGTGSNISTSSTLQNGYSCVAAAALHSGGTFNTLDNLIVVSQVELQRNSPPGRCTPVHQGKKSTELEKYKNLISTNSVCLYLINSWATVRFA